MKPILVALLCLGLIPVLSGCPGSGPGTDGIAAGAAQCERPAQRCKVKDNVLGVCMRAAGVDGQFQCTPQH